MELREKQNKTTGQMLSFEEFCQHFGIKKPSGYAPIVDAYIQYENDFTYGGYVSADNYWGKSK